MQLNRILIILLVSICFACNSPDNSTARTSVNQAPVDMREELITQNKKKMQEEVIRIDEYISAHQLPMTSSGTGLRMLVKKKGTGDQIRLLSRVSLAYQVNLLDGTYCYSSDSSGVLDIIIGQSDEPSGLQEGLLQLHNGSEAMMIIPSYLAYGLTGDGDRIPGRESLVYEVKVLSVSNN